MKTKTFSLMLSFIIFLLLVPMTVFAGRTVQTDKPTEPPLPKEVQPTAEQSGGTDTAVINRASNQQTLLPQVQEQGIVRVIVGLNVAFTPEGDLPGPLAINRQQRQIAQAQENILNTLSGSATVNAKYQIIPYMALTVDEAALQDLLQSPEVTYIQEDRLSAPTLGSSIPHIGGDVAHAAGTTGTGWTVAVLDSGVQWNHEFLGGAANSRVVGEACFSTTDAGQQSTAICGPVPHVANSNIPGCLDGGTNICAHGTHVAGIAAGSQQYASVSYDGVAPDAGIFAVQVFSRFPQSFCATYGYTTDCVLSYDSDQLSGLQEIYTQQANFNFAAINMSLGGGRYYDEATCDADEAPKKAVIDSLRSIGIATVISSGNSSYKDSIGAPGCISTAVAVGATNDSDVVASFSNSSSLVELLAPGVAVDSSVPLDNGVIYDNYNGTSMAAPHVTGAWALVKQNNPTASVSDVLNILQNTGVIVTDTNSIGIPRIQLDAATETGELVGTVTAAGTGNPIPNATVSTTGAGSYTTTTDANGDYILPVPVGNYNVTATAYGYQPLTVNNIAVNLNGTSTQDFALTAATSYLVSGVVTDAATGWPLYARIDIPEYPGSPVWTDPETGAYSVNLAGDTAYNFTVSAWVDGYTNATRTVGPLSSSSTQNFALAANAFVCTAPGYSGTSTSIFNNSFETAFAADGWAQVDTNGTSGNWTRPTSGANPTAAPHTGNRMAMFNSYSATSGNQTRLYRTNGLNLSSYTSPVASFWLFNGSCGWPGNDTVQLQISTNGGSTWNNVGSPVARMASGGWQQHSFDISAYAGAGMTNVRLGLLGTSGFACNIYVDDVTVVENICTPTSGELVLGNVYDANTSAGINGATISNEDGYNTTSAATPTDPNVDDGFYALFSPVGSKIFTASATHYADDVDTVAVVANAITQHDFFLDAGQLSYTPTAVNITIPAGASTNQPLTLANDGSVAANFNLLELGTAVNMTLDDGVMDNSIGLGGSQFVWFNRFTPAPAAYPFQLRQVSVIFQDSVAVGDTVELVVWADADGNPNNGATLQYTENVQVIHNDGASWNDFTLAAPVLLNGPGDVLIGLVNRASVSGVTDYPAAIDQTASQGRSWIGSYGGNVPEPPTLPAPNNWGVIDNVAPTLAGNWMIRGIGYQDVPWLSESPTSGVVPGLNNQIINLTLDASALSPGQYTTQLATHHDTPYPVANVPITLTVFTGYLWNGNMDTDWDEPANWTPNGTPSGFARVTIDPVNLTGASVWPVLNVDATVLDLTVEADAELSIPNGRSLTVNGSLTNNGLLRQTINNLNSPTTFLGMGGYGGVEINPSGNMGNTTVEIGGHQNCTTNPTSQPVQRCFNISPAAPQTATIRFYYLDSEANGNPENALSVYHWNGSGWDLQTGTTTHSSGGNPRWVQVTGVENYSPFVLDNSVPTAVSLSQFAPGTSSTGTAVFLILLLAAFTTLSLVARRRQNK